MFNHAPKKIQEKVKLLRLQWIIDKWKASKILMVKTKYVTCSCAYLKSSIFRERMSELLYNEGKGLLSATAVALSWNWMTYQHSLVQIVNFHAKNYAVDDKSGTFIYPKPTKIVDDIVPTELVLTLNPQGGYHIIDTSRESRY